MTRTVTSLLVIAGLLAALVLSACGDSGTSDKETRLAAALAASKQKAHDQKREIDRLNRENRRLRKELAKPRGGGGSPGGSTTSDTPTPTPSTSSCSTDGLSVGPNTSCSFAQNVRGVYLSTTGGDQTFEVNSPVTGKMYTMTCTAGVTTVCRGGNDAVVYIR